MDDERTSQRDDTPTPAPSTPAGFDAHGGLPGPVGVDDASEPGVPAERARAAGSDARTEIDRDPFGDADDAGVERESAREETPGEDSYAAEPAGTDPLKTAETRALDEFRSERA